MTNRVTKTAPRRIFLQVSDDACDRKESFPEPGPDLTWCRSSCVACEVEYVRADLVSRRALKRILETENDGYNARKHAGLYP